MTTHELQREYDRKVQVLERALSEEVINEEVHDALLERVKNETFFAVSVLCDLESLPIAAGH